MASCGSHELPIVEEFDVCRDDFAGSGLGLSGEMLEPRPHLVARALELAALVSDATACLEHCNLRCFERDGTADRKSSARDHSTQAAA